MMSSLARSYHHGDLRHALIAEASRQARAGGPAAISLREVTRAVGVSPNAAYRHFSDREDLLRAAAAEAQNALARAIMARREGKPVPADVIYPTIDDGVTGVAFVEACVRSSSRNGAWVAL